jgi:two-component system CheB/CheR fusion protein
MNTLAFVQRTIIRSLSSAVLVLDPDGRIKAWNLGAERLLGVGESDAIAQTLWSLHVPAIDRGTLQRVRKALAHSTPQRLVEKVPYELPNGSRGQAMISAVPIVDNANMLGSVIIFEDVTRLATLHAELAALKSGDDELKS